MNDEYDGEKMRNQNKWRWPPIRSAFAARDEILTFFFHLSFRIVNRFDFLYFLRLTSHLFLINFHAPKQSFNKTVQMYSSLLWRGRSTASAFPIKTFSETIQIYSRRVAGVSCWFFVQYWDFMWFLFCYCCKYNKLCCESTKWCNYHLSFGRRPVSKKFVVRFEGHVVINWRKKCTKKREFAFLAFGIFNYAFSFIIPVATRTRIQVSIHQVNRLEYKNFAEYFKME